MSATIGPVVGAQPYAWPYDGSVPVGRTALLCIDWQTDFCGPGGYVDGMGYDIGLTRAGLPATAKLLDHVRGLGMLVVHTREGHDPDLPEVAPAPGEVVVDKPGKGAFYATNLDLVLRTHGITHLILTGITTDVCVHTTMREANDRGFECLILSDCTGATDPRNHAAALHMVTMQGGVFGCVATSLDVIAATS
jgi:nicotinamidase-related amidase